MDSKIHVIYLAAGSSRRFEGNKLLYQYRKKALFEHGLDMLIEVSKERADCSLYVVTRYEQIEKAARDKSIPVIPSVDSDLGLSYTIKAGIEAISGKISDDDYLCFVVADQPYLSKATMHRLFDETRTGAKGIRARDHIKEGNPSLFHASLVPELLALTGDEGGKKVLKRYSYVTIDVYSYGELRDIDERLDVERSYNIVITGSKKTGKTTLLHRVLHALSAQYDGYVTVEYESFFEGSTYQMNQIGTSNMEPISSYVEIGTGKARFRPVEETFETFGVACIKQAIESDKPWIVLDEIGRFERNCELFLQSIEEAFASEKTVFAVLKKEAMPHLEAILLRKDVIVVDLDHIDLESAYQYIRKKVQELAL